MKEARRYSELKLLQRAGEITGLSRQVPFELIPKQTDENGKLVERAISYIADFVYQENGKAVVEDVKSEATRTELYVIKRKLMYWRYGIKIKEV